MSKNGQILAIFTKKLPKIVIKKKDNFDNYFQHMSSFWHFLDIQMEGQLQSYLPGISDFPRFIAPD